MSRPRNSASSHNTEDAGRASESDLYGVLGISRSATADEIRIAYKKAALRWHPDKNPDNRVHAERMFKAVARAYEVLSNTESREQYDAHGLEGVGQAPSGRNQRRASDFSFDSTPFDSAFRTGSGFDHGPRRHHNPFVFHDPFEVFRNFFGADGDPFAAMFDDFAFGRRRHPQSRNIDSFALGGFGFGGMGGLETMFNIPAGAQGTYFSSSSFSSGHRGTTRSQQSTTQIVNGQRVTKTITRTEGPDGIVHEDVDEKVEEMPRTHQRHIGGYSFDDGPARSRLALPTSHQRIPAMSGIPINHSRSSVFF